MISGRFEWKEMLLEKFRDNNKKVAWFHAASLGEFEQARPVMETFAREFPNFDILLSFFSPSGYEIRKNYPLAFHVCYLPFDSQKNAEDWVKITKPSIAFFVKYEFWYFYSSELRKNNIPLISFSTIFRKNQIYFRSLGAFNRKILRNFQKFFVQNKESLYLLKSIEIENGEIAGDTRFDRVIEIAEDKNELPIIHEFKGEKKLLVIGSAWNSDIEIIVPLIQKLKSIFRFVIVPHEVDEKTLQSISNRLGAGIIFYESFDPSLVSDDKVLVVDTIGILSQIYKYADVAFVGGAFGDGLHNILEAAVFGVPVYFGNRNYGKFKEAVDLISLQVAFPVANSNELHDYIMNVYKNDEELKKMRNALKIYFESNKGATKKIIDYAQNILQQ